ncbi:MAG: MOSC domain-containing protein [Acidimicrobiales bacterium]|nr:MOSC domain-containing protein [Actinomycetota bacterium]
MTEPTGTVTGCWRYPVKSMQGLAEDALEVTAAGVVGDRARALVDPATGHILTAKRVEDLLFASATDDGIALPDGTVVGVDSPHVDDALSAWLGRPVHLAAGDEAGQRSFEMTFDPPNDDAEYYEIPAPPATFLDSAQVHVVNAATLRGCAAARPDLDWDVRRFRPNVLVDLGGDAFAEQAWIGGEVRVGDVVLHVEGPTVRCAMPLRAQPDGIEREPELFEAMSELNEVHPNHLGLYCRVVSGGRVAVGDAVAAV